ncbi:unnamed protein product [Durusdinium trenchii]|uniref:Uncharacterized protein n=1 Tax=Durusdinium trenchii TaxID=1381693 RepID=A0ABP0MH98_9DINO
MSVVAEPKAFKVLQRLLDVGISFRADQEGLTALHYAAFVGSEEAVGSLLAARASVDALAQKGVCGEYFQRFSTVFIVCSLLARRHLT